YGELVRVEHEENAADARAFDVDADDVVEPAIDEGQQAGEAVDAAHPDRDLAVGQRGPGESRDEGGHALRAEGRPTRRDGLAATVRVRDDIFCEYGEEPVDVASAGGGKETSQQPLVHLRVHGRPPTAGVGEAMSGAPFDLAAVRLGLADDRRDLAVAE